jgi:hypothetical protein
VTTATLSLSNIEVSCVNVGAILETFYCPDKR